MFVCSCFGITEQQVRDHAATGACTPRQMASACGAGTDCGGCVRRIQALLGRGGCPRSEATGLPAAATSRPAQDGVPAGAGGPLPALAASRTLPGAA
ncbi:bacterioferritin-associated ferredoxin [Streptomyces sp. NPDC059740]|uniref:(2Fe-2S)-binding protein n=1 Tax=Streptomyces sp. NPDC059740 TaxID=3346926 RepID=UPI00364A0952